MSNTNSFSKVLKLTQLAILSAIIILMTVVPYLGYISYGWLSITIIHIPVIIGAVVMGPGAGSALGAVWGITCTLKALLAPPSPLDGMIFRNPVVSIVPRILVGLVAGLIFACFRKSSKKSVRAVGSGVAALFGTIVNTALVMSLIYLFYGSSLGTELGISSVTFGGLINYVLAAFGINGILEIAAAVVLTVPISTALLSRFKTVK